MFTYVRGPVPMIQVFSTDVRKGITYKLTKQKRADALAMLDKMEGKIRELESLIRVASTTVMEATMFMPKNSWILEFNNSMARRRYE